MVAVADGVEGVLEGGGEAETPRHGGGVDRQRAPRQRAGPERRDVRAREALREALEVAGEPPVVREEVVAQGHRLRALEVRVARHGGLQVLRREGEEARLEAEDLGLGDMDRLAQPEALVERDLVVARARGVDLGADGPEELGEADLEVRVHVLQILPPREGAGFHLAEFLFALSLLAVHLSAFGEELVFWSSSEAGFLLPVPELGSGSSLMPHKRNPDVAELARGKSGRVLGDLVALLTMLKGLPLSYNRDLQEDKAPVFDAAQQVLETLVALHTALPALRFNTAAMAAAATDPRLVATDLAEYLVGRGVPFREAHEAVALYLEKHAKITADSLRAFDARFQADVAAVLDPATAVSRRASPGGPSPAAVRPQLAHAEDRLGLERYQLSRHAESVQLLDQILTEESE